MDDVTAYKRKGSFFLRKKGGISKDRIMSDPKFARVRENNAEFGETGQSVKALRDAFSMISKKREGWRDCSKADEDVYPN